MKEKAVMNSGFTIRRESRHCPKDFTGDYGNVKLSGGQVIMYDGNNCSIFLKSGIQKFEGEIETNIRGNFSNYGS